MNGHLKKNILITGERGAGKTTLVREVVSELGVKPGGYLTRGVPERGMKKWCEIISLTDGVVPERGIMARREIGGSSRACGLGVDPIVLEGVGAVALERAVGVSPLIVMDEIGHMEIVSQRFQDAVLACLDSRTPVLGVIKIEHGPFVDRIKARPDVELIELSNLNYGAMKRHVKAVISSLLRPWESNRDRNDVMNPHNNRRSMQ